VNKINLFVYGSMTEGMVHFGKIKDFIQNIKPASAKGSMFKLKVGFPAMSLAGEDRIHGQLVELKSESNLLLQLLDQFYGFVIDDPGRSLFLRKTISVSVTESSESDNETGDESLTEAWIYALNTNRMPAEIVLIPGGDWMSYLKSNPPLAEQLTARQRNYVLKLGASSSREIVPIDLPLYRELLKLELIVDKGRRLALSKFGIEVYKHLL
jgi:gamma-glutamylcyclotransferase (GGCT)/AIG2-like uncharacterized protein YtfP